MPGDELLAHPAFRFTRAITIRAPAAAVWPWIVQIGQDRAGFYSNTWLENLTGAAIHNADTIHPEWQQRTIGDRVLLARPDLFGGAFARVAQTRIVALQPQRLIADIPGRFVLEPLDSQSTRVFLRESVPATFTARAINALAWDPMHFIMQQRMLRGIKERAERRPLVPPAIMMAARTGWILAAAGLSGLFLARRQRRFWLILPLAIGVPIVHATGDRDAALAAFLATGITLLGLLAFGRRWWPSYLLLASGVALILLLAPDPYTVFGILFLPAALVGTLYAAGLTSTAWTVLW
jgi:hypothetical protein